MNEPIRIVIADDHPVVREGVFHSLASEPDLTVVGQAGSGEEALRLAIDLVPDVVLLDIGMPGWGGLATVEKLSQACPVTKVVMLTVYDDEDRWLAAFKAGARGYVLKGVSPRELANIVRLVAAGEVYVSPTLAADMLRELTGKRPQDPLGELSDREREVLSLVAEGLTNREIGERVHLAEKTVKNHMTNILGKLHVRSRVEAALLAARQSARK
ncbi:MAG: response regulator transcription factor [Betaproteobacteria bacterium]|nr:response regulator transcription factor [Betaproteobacteria bacterium]